MLDPLLRAIYESPEDWDRRLVLADYYEESGDLDRSEFWRWTAKEKSRPYPSSVQPNKFFWYRWNGIDSKFCSDVRENVFDLMPNPKYSQTYSEVQIFFQSQEEAYEALFLAWKQGKEKQ